jgi:hypothetical protein
MEELKISKETAQLGIGAGMPSIDSPKNWSYDKYFDTVCNCCICKNNFIADDGRQMCYECYSDEVS